MSDTSEFVKKNRGKLYLICFTHRSGSTHLCSLMEKNGLGVPQEYYYPCRLEDRCVYWNERLNNLLKNQNGLEYFKSIFDVNPRHNSLTGIKIAWDSLVVLLSEAQDILYELEPKFIYLTRKNKLMQAISWAKASQNNIWSSADINHTNNKIEIKYNREQINKHLKLILHEENKLSEFLHDKNFLNLCYEDGFDMNEISFFLDTPITKCEKTLIKDYDILRNRINNEWHDRYMSEII